MKCFALPISDYANHPYHKRPDYKKIEKDVFCVYRDPQSHQTTNLRKETYVSTSHWSFKLVRVVTLALLILGSLGCVFIAKSMRIRWRSAIDSFRNRCVVYIKITNKEDIKSFYKTQDAINPLTVNRMAKFLKPSEINAFAQTCKAYQTILDKISLQSRSLYAIEKAARTVVKLELNPGNEKIFDGWRKLVSMIQPEDIKKSFVISYESRSRMGIRADEYVGNLGCLVDVFQNECKSYQTYKKLRLPISEIEEKNVNSSLKSCSALGAYPSLEVPKTIFSFDIKTSHFYIEDTEGDQSIDRK